MTNKKRFLKILLIQKWTQVQREFLHFKAGLKVGLLLAVECLI